MNASKSCGRRRRRSRRSRPLTTPARRTTLARMKASRDRILTSHAGSLPRPDELIEAYRAHEAEGAGDDAGFPARLRAAVADRVRRPVDPGIGIPGDGEFGKSMGHRVNYRAWWSYSFQRLGGLELGTT